MHKFIADLRGSEAVDQMGWQWSGLGVVFTRVHDTAEKVEGCVWALDGVESEATAEDRTQVQVLQSIGEEVGVHEAEEARRDVAIVAGAAFVRVCCDPGGGERQVVCRVNGAGVER